MKFMKVHARMPTTVILKSELEAHLPQLSALGNKTMFKLLEPSR